MNILFCSLEEGFRGISVRYMSSYIKSKGYSSKILFFNRDRRIHPSSAGFSEEESSEFVNFVKNNQIDWVGISIMTENFLEARDLIAKAKKNLPKTKFVLGGVHATVCPKDCVLAGADFVIVGDGEKPLYELISGKDKKNIKGLAFLSGNEIIINPPDPSDLVDLGELPFPEWGFDNVFFFKKNKIEKLTAKDFRSGSTWAGTYYPLTTSRGCPYHCAYCCNVNRLAIRRNSIARIMEELSYIKKVLPFTCGLNIQDDSFYLGSDEWIAEFCKELNARFGWPFVVRLMPRLVSEKRIKLLKEGGVEFVSMGIQGSDRLNKELYSRLETSENFLKACRILCQYNIKYVIDVLLDNPYETEDDLKNIAYALNRAPKPFGVNAFSLTLFPGTELAKRAKAEGYYDKFSTDPYEGQTLQTYSFLTKLYRHEYDLGKTGKYITPVPWRKLIYAIAPMAPESVVKRIIERGVMTQKSIKEIDALYKKYAIMVKFGNWFKEIAPSLFVVAINIYMKLRGQKSKVRAYMAKRFFDFLFSLLGLIITLPLLLFISFWIKIDSPGTVFYRGERVGQFGRKFRIFKFRTMVDKAEKIGGPSTASDDPRLTKIGIFLKKYQLDELPQLINVFLGQMSFVGPRPEVPFYVEMMTKEEKSVILSVPQGMTDLASLWNFHESEVLSGSPDPEKAYLEKIRPEKIRLQLKYVKNHSFLLDLKIIAKTIFKLFL